jgi:hypothetical protein
MPCRLVGRYSVSEKRTVSMYMVEALHGVKPQNNSIVALILSSPHVYHTVVVDNKELARVRRRVFVCLFLSFLWFI